MSRPLDWDGCLNVRTIVDLRNATSAAASPERNAQAIAARRPPR